MALDQEGFRWRNDDGDEDAATWKANQDTNGVSVALDTNVRLRIIVDVSDSNGPASADFYRLEARQLTGGDWFEVVPPESTDAGPIVLSLSPNVSSSGEVTTPQLTPPANKVESDFADGRMWDDQSGVDPITLVTDQYTELEFSIRAEPSNGAFAGETYEFRVTRKEGAAAGGGGPLELISSEFITDPNSATLTIPADATAVYLMWGYFHGSSAGEGLGAATLNGLSPNQTFEILTNGSSLCAAGVAAWYNPATGSRSLTAGMNWTTGPNAIAYYVKNGSTTWRDADAQSLFSAEPTVTLTTVSGDLVLKFATDTTTIEVSAGWDDNGEQTNGTRVGRASSITATGATQVCDEEQDAPFTASVAAVSIAPA